MGDYDEVLKIIEDKAEQLSGVGDDEPALKHILAAALGLAQQGYDTSTMVEWALFHILLERRFDAGVRRVVMAQLELYPQKD